MSFCQAKRPTPSAVAPSLLFAQRREPRASGVGTITCWRGPGPVAFTGCQQTTRTSVNVNRGSASAGHAGNVHGHGQLHIGQRRRRPRSPNHFLVPTGKHGGSPEGPSKCHLIHKPFPQLTDTSGPKAGAHIEIHQHKSYKIQGERTPSNHGIVIVATPL